MTGSLHEHVVEVVVGVGDDLLVVVRVRDPKAPAREERGPSARR
jgi:hypothetical protein